MSDKLLEYIIRPVVVELGFDPPERGDHISKSGMITTQVFTRIFEDDLVIADLTGLNPNVFYELAVRHMVRKPFVQMIHRDDTLPFDIALNRTLRYDFDVATVTTCKVELERMIRWLENEPGACDTALSLAIDFMALDRSEHPLEKSTNQILSLLQEILESIPRGGRDRGFGRSPSGLLFPEPDPMHWKTDD